MLSQFGNFVDDTTFAMEYNVSDNVRLELRATRMVWFFSHGVELYCMDCKYVDIADMVLISPEGEGRQRQIMLTCRVRRPARVMRKLRFGGADAGPAGMDPGRWEITINERWVRCAGDFSGTGQFGSALVYRFALSPASQFVGMRVDNFESHVRSHYVAAHLHRMGLLRTPHQGTWVAAQWLRMVKAVRQTPTPPQRRCTATPGSTACARCAC